ncbi:MAG: hypothetical protein AAFR04_13320 [Pseudomonadota bacterium]
MSSALTFSDEQLTAYLDGEADAALCTQIESALERDAALAARLQALEVDAAAIRATFDALLLSAPPAPAAVDAAESGRMRVSEAETSERAALRDVTSQDRASRDATSQGGSAGPSRARRHDGVVTPTRPVRALAWAACAAGFALLGGLGGWLAAGSQAQSWDSAAATYHALYVRQTLAPVIAEPARQARELARVSSALGRPLNAADLRSLKDLAYKRAQVLGYEGRPLIQLAFLSRDGVPIALCIIRAAGSSGSGDVATARYDGLNAARWSKDGYDFLLLGNKDAEQLRTYAEHFRAKL